MRLPPSLAGDLLRLLLLGILFGCWLLRVQRRGPSFVRGRRRPAWRNVTAPRLDPSGETVLWGGRWLPEAVATTHFLVMGTTGSGKTLLLNSLMRSVLPFIGKRRRDGAPRDRRALIYDAKGDVLSTLHGMAECRIVTLHPFDARGAAWDMGKDITTPAAALQAAALLMPEERQGTSNPFFTLAARSLLRGVMLSFLQTVGEDWTLRDVVLALRFEERLRRVLEKTPDGRAIISQFFQGGETFEGIRATIAAKMAPFEVIAAAWDAASERVSLRAFMEGESVLVLGNDESTRVALDAVNRLLFQRLSELVLSGEDTRTRRTWFFLDEVREAGRLDGLSRLMTKGRSKGACVALGFQAIEGLRDVYGPNVADEIAGLCNNKAVLRLDSPVSARWARDLFGKVEEMDRRAGRSWTRGGKGGLSHFGRGRTLSEQRLTVDAVMDSEIMTLPPAGPRNGLCGLFLTREDGAFRASMDWKTVMALQPERAASVPDFVPRAEGAQCLREWDAGDHERLGLLPLSVVDREAGGPYGGVGDRGGHLRGLRPVRKR